MTIEGRLPFRAPPLGFYRPFTGEQYPVVVFFMENMEHRAVQRLVGDRKYVVPAGGLLYSRNRVAAVLDVTPGLVKRTVDKLVQLDRVQLFNAYSAEKAPKVLQRPVHAVDHREDHRGDQFFSTDHRIIPTLLIWQNLLVTFGMKSDAELAREESIDHRRDHRVDQRGDHRGRGNLRPVG